MILTPFDTPCIMIENLSDIPANDLFKHKCLRLKDEYTKKYIDFYNTERYRRYGVTGILPAEYTHEYNCISNEWQRKVLTVGIGTDVVIVVLKHIQMFQHIYKRMEGLPISIEGNKENEKRVFNILINLEIVKKVLSSIKEEQEFLENCGMSVDSELKTYSYYSDVEHNWNTKSGLNRWRTKKGVNRLEKNDKLTCRILTKNEECVKIIGEAFCKFKEEVHKDKFLSKKFTKSIIEYPHWNDDNVEYYLFEYDGFPIGLICYVYSHFSVGYQVVNKGIRSLLYDDNIKENVKSIPQEVIKRLGEYMHCKSIEILRNKGIKYSNCGGVFGTMKPEIALYKRLMNDSFFGMKVYK